jgi:predicted transcriptional regulator
MERRSALFSINPEFADAILAGQKQYEFRRNRLRLEAGDLILIYSTRPKSAVVGGFYCKSIVEASPAAISRKFAKAAGTSASTLRRYLDESDRATAIQVSKPFKLAKPITLADIRRRIPGFMPPQSYKFIEHSDPLSSLLARVIPNGRP